MSGFPGKELTDRLLAWYHEHARSLPWREDPTPYHVWISEIMLQQTRVETVRPYYLRFIEALPDIPALATCPDDRLMKLWEGLGYYSRARNLKKTAQLLMQQGGNLPHDRDQLLGLPGIGHYTAGAILSIAFGIPAPAVDGNVLRVLSRVYGSREDIMTQSCRSSFEELVSKLLPQEMPGAFNQALMDLGAMVCIPSGAPLCRECPLQGLCRACEDRSWDVIPVRAAKKPRKTETKTVLVIRDQENVILRQRPEKGLLAGLYELPNYAGFLSSQEAISVVENLGLKPIRIRQLEDAKHVFTHVEWRMKGYLVLVEDAGWGTSDGHDDALNEEAEENRKKGRCFPARPESAAREYAVPSAFSAYMRLLEVPFGQEADEKTMKWSSET